MGSDGGAYHGGRVREDKPPPYFGPQETRIWAKERVKKDNHNLSKWPWSKPDWTHLEPNIANESRDMCILNTG